MKGLVWGLFGFIAALWSLFAWLLHGLAGAGGAAVNTVARWLEIDLASIQWLADGLALAGGFAQVLVIIFWLMGMGLIVGFAWMGSRTVDGVREASEQLGQELARDPVVRGTGAVLEGEVVGESQRPTQRLEP